MAKLGTDVAVVAPHATSLYIDNGAHVDAPAGGAELQTFFLAHALAAAGFSVAHVVFDHADLPSRSNGVVLSRLPPRSRLTGWRRGRPGLRGRNTRQLLQELSRVDPRVIIQRNAGFDTGVIALFAKRTRSRFVFSSSSLGDFTLSGLGNHRTRLAFRAGLRLADAVVVQTEEQRDLAARLRGRDSVVIRSFCAPAPLTESSRDYFLWIGGLIDYKGPLDYLRLAGQMPNARFVMVATERGPRWQHLAEQVRAGAQRLPNLELLPASSHDALLERYDRAVAVVNTSTVEGFPNTFMEGWARGVPALSLNVDPDGVIRRHRLGVVTDGSIDAFRRAARELWDARHDSAQRSLHLRDYIAGHHSPHVVGKHWSAVVEGLLRDSD